MPYGALAAVANGVVSTGQTILQNRLNSSLQDKQMYHDKNMAKYNHSLNKETMALQNQYQIEQWQRENEYNDPSAVAERYRAAGINPRAAFGQGSAHGAGVAGGLSSAPSGSGALGSASNIITPIRQPDIASLALGAVGLGAKVRKTDAEAEGVEIDNMTREQQNLLLLEKARAEIVKILNDSNLSKAEKEVKEKELSWYDQQISESQSRISRNTQENKESDVRIDKLNKEIDNVAADTELKYELRKKENTLIELLHSQKDLTEEQIRKIGADIAQGWVKLGIDGVGKLNEIVSTWVPAPGKLIGKIGDVLGKSSKKSKKK